jgi:hypothetical protein
MPLSEEEQRILRQIEQHLYSDDPDFAHSVSQTTLYRHSLRSVRWGILALVAGLVFMLATLQVSYLVAFAGFGGMMFGAVIIEQNLRKVGRVGLAELTGGVPRPHLRRNRRSDTPPQPHEQ